MMKRYSMMALLTALCLYWLVGCAVPSAEDSSAQTEFPVTEQPGADASLPPVYIPPEYYESDEAPNFPGVPSDEVIAAIDEAGEMEPFFQNTDKVLLLWPETDEVLSSPLRNFIGGWGVVLANGTLVLNAAECHAFYDENGQPRHVDQQPVDHDATVIVGLELPEEWRGLTLTIIAPMDEGYPYYVGTGLPQTVRYEDAPESYEYCGLWYWQEDRYVRVFEGVDHGETFSFEPATVEAI